MLHIIMDISAWIKQPDLFQRGKKGKTKLRFEYKSVTNSGVMDTKHHEQFYLTTRSDPSLTPECRATLLAPVFLRHM